MYFCMYVSPFDICRQYASRNKLKLEKKIVQKRGKLIDETEMKFYLLCNIVLIRVNNRQEKGTIHFELLSMCI